MCAETIHQDTEFQRRRRAYFQDFMIRHRPQARIYKEKGLLNEEGSKGWRNVARHQLLSAVMTETVLELLGMPRDESERLINLSLTHDVDKRRQQESLSREGVISDELNKSQRPLVATSTNFMGLILINAFR